MSNSGLLIIDATTGFTTGVEASFAALTRDQIGAGELVGTTSVGAFSLRWRDLGDKLPAGIRVDLERELGQLP